MNLLFLTGSFPCPPTDGWRIRVFAFLRSLAQRHRVTVASFRTSSDDPHAVDRLREYGVDVYTVPRSRRYSPFKLAQGVFSSTAFPVLNYADERMRRLVNQLLDRQPFDLLQAESVHMAQYCQDLTLPRILDLHNIESLLMKRYARRARNPVKRLYAELTWRKLAAYERGVCRHFTHCFTCSDEERVLLQTCAGVERISVVPNGVYVSHYAGEETKGDLTPRRLVFVGRMDYHANVDAVQWFCREALPGIRARYPDVILQIVGGHPVPGVARLATPGLIEVTGFVPDTRPYLLGAAAVVVPLRIGGGTRLKILEAFATGKPVISTTLGAEGIDAVPGRDLLLADTPADFVERISTVFEDPDLRARLRAGGRRLAINRYDWDKIVKGAELIYECCLSMRGHQPGAMPAVASRSL